LQQSSSIQVVSILTSSIKKAFDVFLEEYEKHANKSVLDRLEMVEARGRYKE
jgi:tRNA A-37 threonylcarbamoyl transferase component Bud32